MNHFRNELKATLGRLGLLEAARLAMRPYRSYRAYRDSSRYRDRFRRFAKLHGEVVARHPKPLAKRGVALVSSVHFPEVELELAVLKALELAGFTPVLLTERDDWIVRQYYKLAGIEQVHRFTDFVEAADLAAGEAAVDAHGSFDELLKLEYGHARVGRFAVSTAMRHLRLGSFDFDSPDDRQVLATYVARSMAYTDAAERILARFEPELTIFIDKGYSPKGELFDSCLAAGVDCISWDMAHRASTLMMKRFNMNNRDTSTDSISAESWRRLKSMEFTDAHRQRLEQELYEAYSSGDWYSVSGTQLNKKLVEADELRERLGLDPEKKTAIVFPHVSWDATLFWGEALYGDYETWLVDTARAACANERLNWVIKIHPAHIGKAVREGYEGEIAEMVTLREHIGELPPHVKLIPADTDINTYSLFPLMDYCVTVRGRVGAEAARVGIPVLTGGHGPYDRRGFTIDSPTREQYLENLAQLHERPKMSDAERELAERYSYGFFLQRTLPFQSVSMTYAESLEKADSVGRIHLERPEDWDRAEDVRMLAEWLGDRSREDFMLPE